MSPAGIERRIVLLRRSVPAHAGKTRGRLPMLQVSAMQTVAECKNGHFTNGTDHVTRAALSLSSYRYAAKPNAIGQRANYVEIKDGQWRIQYSHWGANEIARDIFWGPNRALGVVRGCEPAESWLDEVSCEGAVLMDRDRHCLLFFAGGALEDNLPLRRIYLQMLAIMWLGWQIRWADNGLVDIARHVGDDASKIIVRDDEFEKPASLGRIRNLRRLTARERGIWFTVCDDNGRLADNYFVDAMQSLMLAGPVLVDRFPTRLIDPIPPEDRVKGGAWIDAGRKELIFWRADAAPDLERRFGARWPGWSVRRQTEGWQTQLELSGRRAPELRADPANLVSAVIDLVLDEPRLHPKHVLQQMMQLHDKETQLNAYFLQQHQGVALSRRQKASLLGEAVARLAVPGTEELEDLLAGELMPATGEAAPTVASAASPGMLRAA
jgi:hypothetical protein